MHTPDHLCRCRICKPGTLADARALARVRVSCAGLAFVLLLVIMERAAL